MEVVGQIKIDFEIKKMFRLCGIYKITSPTGKIYIGQSKDIQKRWRKYRNLDKGTKSQRILWRSFLKHGVESHQFDIIEHCPEEHLNCSERFWQDEFDVIGKNGLNCILQQYSEKRRVYSKETLEKISGENSARYGKKHSEETKKKISEAHTGKVKTQEHIKNISLANSGEKSIWYGKTHTEETKQKMSAWQLGGGNHQAKLVLDLATGIFYETAIEASKAYGINHVTLNCYLNGKLKNKTNLIYV